MNETNCYNARLDPGVADANGTSTITSVEYQTPTTSAVGTSAADSATLVSALDSSILNKLTGDTAGITVNLADLTGAAVGQTFGTNITLDTNAAGNGWLIDTTPADNSEYLPTSNPNEWVAKAGSAAAGKMDMLSVLLHEYGHALGIDHSADPNDFMGTTLTAGVRRLPTVDEMALMQGLVAQAKAGLTESTPTLTRDSSLSLSLWERVGVREGGGNNAPAFPTLPLGTSFLGFLGLLRSSCYGGVSIAPDASTLVTQYDWAANATLTNGSLNAADGWSTRGAVDIGNGAATLREISNTQTRLSQVFLFNPTDRFLSFTLSGTALDDLTGALPHPAPLPGGEGANVAQGADQPLDAFEVALLEDGTLAFDPFAQVDNPVLSNVEGAAVLQLGSHVVDQPAHGAVTVNADGTFSYTPTADYFGADSFTYRLSDGPVESNLATVSLNIAFCHTQCRESHVPSHSCSCR